MRSIDEVRQRIAADPALAALLAEVESRLLEDADPGHDLGHLLRVAVWTLRLGGDAVDERSALAAALLHDLVNPPKDSPASARAGESSAELAADLLTDLGFADSEIDLVAAGIRDHGYRRGAVPESPLGRALQDADRLDALGAVGIFRTLACGLRLGADLYEPSDPWARRRELDDHRYTVDHFFTKLLRLPATLHSEEARREARHRIDLMRRFLEHLGAEITDPLA